MSWIAVGAAVAAAAVSAYNTKKTAKKQDKATAEGIRRQAEQQRQANSRLNQTLNTFEQSNSGDIRDSLMDRYGNQLRMKQQQALAGVNTSGATSDAARELIKRGSGETMSRAGNFGDLFARIDAPTDQRINEGMERTDLGSDLGVFTRNSAAEDYLTRLRLASVRRSPWLDMLSAGLSGYASGAGGAAGAGAGTSTGNLGPNYGYKITTGTGGS